MDLTLSFYLEIRSSLSDYSYFIQFIYRQFGAWLKMLSPHSYKVPSLNPGQTESLSERSWHVLPVSPFVSAGYSG